MIKASKRNLLILMGLLALGSVAPTMVPAQRPGGEDGERRGGRGGDRAGRRFDPEQMRQRMVDRTVERLGLTEEEAEAIKPLVSDVFEKQMDARFGMRFGRRGPDADENPAAAALSESLEDESATADDIKAKMEAFRAEVKKREAALAKTREDLRSVLTVKQEAQLVLMGVLD